MTLTHHETAGDTARGETVQIPEPFSYGVDASQFELYPPKQPW